MCAAEEAASAPRRAKLVLAVAQPRRCLGHPDESPRQVAYLCVVAVSKRLPGTSELSRSLRREARARPVGEAPLSPVVITSREAMVVRVCGGERSSP